MCKNTMKTEQQFLKLISRVSFNDENKIALNHFVHEELDWFYILAQSFKHKITGLIWMNMLEFGMAGYMPRAVSEPMTYYTYASKERYETMKGEISIVIAELRKKDIVYSPLKGAYLIPNIYSDGRKRISNDVDFLIQKENSTVIIDVMKHLGYVMGEFDSHKREVVEYTRQKRILWMSAMDNLPAFYKKTNSPFLDYIVFDFRHSINRDSNIVNKMFNHHFDEKIDCIGFFLHLCYHTYDEAVQYTAHYMLKDLTLMKFCDLREFSLKYINEKQWGDIIDTAKEYELGNALYFCLNALKLIYNDGYEEKVISELGVNDNSIMETYGAKEYGEQLTFKNSFEERLFSFSNKNEMKSKPNWTSL